MPCLRGHFPLNITIVLRALAQHHIVAAGGGGGPAGGKGGKRGAAGGDAWAADVRDSLVPLFSRPFFAEGRQGLLQQVQHLFGFALEHLARGGAIGLQGEPVG